MISSLINLKTRKINFWIFSILFSFSFASIMHLKDYGYLQNNSDIMWSILGFQDISGLSWIDILKRYISSIHGNEPFYWFHIKFIRLFITSEVSVYVFIEYFIMFGMLAVLSRIVSKDKFAIVLACLLFISGGFFPSIYQVWRNTFANILILIGISLSDIKSQFKSRLLIYSSIFFHIGAIILVLLYEIFQWYSKKVKIFKDKDINYRYVFIFIFVMVFTFSYIFKMGLFFADLLGLVEAYQVYYDSLTRLSYRALLNSLTFFIFIYLINKSIQKSNTDLFFCALYFTIILILIINPMPGIFGRFSYFVKFGGSILVAKLIINNAKLGSYILSFILVVFILKINFSKDLDNILTKNISPTYSAPTQGLFNMMFNYDKLLNNLNF